MKRAIILVFPLLIMAKTYAQNNDQEAQLTFSLAQEEMEKSGYDQAIVYLDKVDELNPEAKTKTSYLKAKCYHSLTTYEHDNEKLDKYYNGCLTNIKYYFDNGKDESKKTELLKIKIEVENSKGYRELKANKLAAQEAKKNADHPKDNTGGVVGQTQPNQEFGQANDQWINQNLPVYSAYLETKKGKMAHSDRKELYEKIRAIEADARTRGIDIKGLWLRTQPDESK